MNGRHVAVALAGVLVALTPALLEASVVVELGADELIEYSDTIVACTVTAVESRWDESHRTIHTYVGIDDASFLRRSERLTEPFELRFLGGEVGDEGLIVDGSPKFEVGERVILFLALEDDATSRYAPVLGLFQGRFRVQNAGRADEVVLDGFGREIVGFEDGALVVVPPESQGDGITDVKIVSAEPPPGRPARALTEEERSAAEERERAALKAEASSDAHARRERPLDGRHSGNPPVGCSAYRAKITSREEAPLARPTEQEVLAWVSERMRGIW